MRKKLVVRYSILVFCLLLVVSGAWVFFWREQLLRNGDLQGQGVSVLSPLFEAGIFIFVLILVLVALGVLLGFIFTDGIFRRLRELADQFVGLKSAPFTSRLDFLTDKEFRDVAEAANAVIERLEHEIAEAVFKAAQEQKHFKEEQNLLEAEGKYIYEEKEKLEYVLGRITDGVILLNRNRNIVLLNKAAEEIVGYSRSEAVNKPIGDIVKFFEGQREILMDEYAPGTSGRPASSDNAFLKKRARLSSAQTREKLVDLICVRLTLIHTQDLGYMIILHDLTEGLEIERKQVSLLSSLASELKQPVSMISDGIASSGLSESRNDIRARVGLDHLSLIMKNLLAVGEIENNRVVIETVQIDLISLVKDLVAIIDPLAKERQVSLQYEDVPADFSGVVSGDQAKTRQVILNLFLNAIYYTQAGGSIAVSLSQSGEEVILRIQDTGRGIPKEELKNLFVRFYKGAGGGIGLGLYVSKKLIDLQNGKIWIDSVEGRGTVVSISLPKADKNQESRIKGKEEL